MKAIKKYTVKMNKVSKASRNLYTGTASNETNKFVIWRGQMVSLTADPRIFSLQVKTAFTDADDLIYGVEITYPDETIGGRVFFTCEAEAYAAKSELELVLLHANKLDKGITNLISERKEAM